jgi:hypothetical protein
MRKKKFPSFVYYLGFVSLVVVALIIYQNVQKDSNPDCRYAEVKIWVEQTNDIYYRSGDQPTIKSIEDALTEVGNLDVPPCMEQAQSATYTTYFNLMSALKAENAGNENAANDYFSKTAQSTFLLAEILYELELEFGWDIFRESVFSQVGVQ